MMPDYLDHLKDIGYVSLRTQHFNKLATSFPPLADNQTQPDLDMSLVQSTDKHNDINVVLKNNSDTETPINHSLPNNETETGHPANSKPPSATDPLSPDLTISAETKDTHSPNLPYSKRVGSPAAALLISWSS